MARLAKYFYMPVLIGVLTFLAAPNSAAQVAIGTPAFGSFGGGPFDTVNLGNLNVHFAIPILNKAGRGTPFTYGLTYDSSVWTPVTTGGTTQWQPTPNWGWQTGAPFGTTTYTTTTTTCQYYVSQAQQWFTAYTQYYYQNWVFIDHTGTHHPLTGSTQSWEGETVPGTNCSNPPPDVPSATGTATDGSGYTISISNYTASIVTSPSGMQSGQTNFTDNNGNQITSNDSGQFFDTLSATVPVLTVAGTAPSPTTFTYVAPSGANASYTMNYTAYTVATDFKSGNISEYGPLSAYLVKTINLPDGTKYSFSYEKTPGTCHPLSGTYSANCVTGRIASVILPSGGEVIYAYSGGNNGIESDGSTAGLTRTLSPGGQWKYARSLSGSTWTTTLTDPNSNQTLINFVEDGNTTSPTHNFYEAQRQVKQLISGTQTLLATVISCYNGNYASCSTADVSSPITATDVYTQLPNGKTRLSQVSYNSNGLVTVDEEYTYGVATGSAPGADLIRETFTEYANLTNNITNRPSSVAVYDWTSGTETMLASATYTYDQGTPTATSGTPQQVAITGSRGNLTTAVISTSSTTSLSTTFTYYDTGNPNVVTDVNGAQTTYVYGTATQGNSTISCGNSFATTVNEPLSLSRSYSWNCTGGVQLTMTDENGQVTTTDYSTDSYFWRPDYALDQLQNKTNLSYSGQTAAEATLTFNSSNSVSDLRVTVDGFGRPILSQQAQTPSLAEYDTTETDYNGTGQPSRSTMPFQAVAGNTSSSAPAVTTVYDALGRPTSVTDGDGGTISYTYANNDVLQTIGPAPSGENTKRKQFEYDGLGRLTSVCELTSTANGGGNCAQASPQTGFWTTYTYDALNRLTKVSQNAQSASPQTRTYSYDWMSRLTSESNPENGTTTYAYDTNSTCRTYNGDLVEKKDAVSNVICYKYDALHRETAITYPSGPYASTTASKTFVYDTTTFGCASPNINVKGRLAEAYTGPSTGKITDEGFCYSPRGETTDVYESTPNSGGYYHIPMSYWANGLIETFGPFLGDPQLTYTPDGEGRMGAISDTVPSITYTQNGQPTGNQPTQIMTSCAGSTCYPITYQYDPNTLRMTQYSAALNGGTVSGTLTWNSNGSLQTQVIADAFNSSDAQTCTYGADDLSRIASVNCLSGSTNVWNQNFTYDAFGNITKQVPSGGTGISWIPGYNASTNRYALGGTSYDANGNVTNDTFNRYTWDAEGKTLSTAYSSGPTYTFVYDAFGQEVEWSDNGTYEASFVSIGKYKLSATGQTAFYSEYPYPGGSLSSEGGGLTATQIADWEGTSRAVYTYTGGNWIKSVAHAPFGETYVGSSQNYTGQWSDADTTNTTYYFPARQYRSSQGRWLSPDPAGIGAVDPTNPQTWNRYAYVMNNPLSLIDPFGDDCYTQQTCWAGGLYLPGVDGWDPFQLMGLGYAMPVPGAPCSDGVCPSVIVYSNPGLAADNGGCTNYVMANCGAANNGPQLLPSHTPADLTKPACSAVYNQFVSDMNALNAKYALGWQEAAGAGVGATVVTQPSLWGMAYRISQVNERILGFIGLVAPTVIHTGVAAATDEGQERRALAGSYAQSAQQCDPTR